MLIRADNDALLPVNRLPVSGTHWANMMYVKLVARPKCMYLIMTVDADH